MLYCDSGQAAGWALGTPSTHSRQAGMRGARRCGAQGAQAAWALGHQAAGARTAGSGARAARGMRSRGGRREAWALGAGCAAWAPGLARTVHSVHPT